jgi:hypothetical protein
METGKQKTIAGAMIREGTPRFGCSAIESVHRVRQAVDVAVQQGDAITSVLARQCVTVEIHS